MSRIFAYLFLGVLLTSCASTKEATDDSSKQISTKDYPYISTFHQGVRYKTQGRVEEAVATFEKCLEMRQDDDAVYYALSQLEMTRENFQKSSEYVTKAAELDPNNTWYIQELAYMYFELKEFNKAAEKFEQLTQIEPRNVDWQYGYAETLVRIGENEKAINALNKTEDQVGINPELSVQKYNLYMQMKQPEKGLEELNRAREVFPRNLQLLATTVEHYFNVGNEKEGIELLEKLVEEDPSNGRAHLALADVYRQRGDKTASYDQLKLAFRSSDVEIDTKMKILISFHESSFGMDPEMYELADIMVEIYPMEAKAHSIKGDFLLRVDSTEQALASYVKALQFDKGQYPIWNQVLIMEYQQKKFEDLFKHSKECIDLYPSMSTVYLLNGVSANQLKKYNDALNSLVLGKEMVVNDPAMKAEFEGQIGEAYFGMKEYNSAVENYKKAIKTDPNSLLLKNNFALQLANHKKELELAKSLSKQAVNGAPNQSQFIDTYGWVLVRAGNLKEGIAQLEIAVEKNDKDKLILEHLGDAHALNGDMNKALEFWNKALELDKGNASIQKKIADKKFYEPIF